MLRRSLLVAAALSCLLTAVPQASAQIPSPTPTPSQAPLPEMIRIAAMTPFLYAKTPTVPFVLRLQILNPTEAALENVSVAVTVFRPVISRSALRTALDGGQPTGAAGTPLHQDLAGAVGPGEQQQVDFTVPASKLTPFFTGSGVYPLQVSLSYTDGSRSVMTALPFIGSVPKERLNVTWVIPVRRPIVSGLGGSYSIDDVRALGLDGLTQAMTAVARAPGVPVTLAIEPELLDAVAELAGGGRAPQGGAPLPARTQSDAAALLSAFRSVGATAGEIATVPYAPVDAAALAHNAMATDLTRQLERGRATLEKQTGRAAATTIFVPPDLSIDRTSAAIVARDGATGLLMDPALAGALPPDQRLRSDLFGWSEPVRVATSGGVLGALLPDVPIEQRLDGAAQGVLLSQALIAESASAWLELPSLANERLLVLASHQMPSPTTLAHALPGLGAAPWVQMRTATDAMASLPILQPGETPSTPVALPILAREDRPYLRAARVARRALLSLQKITQQTPLPEIDGLDRAILLSESAEWELDPARGLAISGAVRDRIQGMLRAVRVAPGRRVTLTSRSGSVPVTVLNGNDFPVTVRVALNSTKLDFPNGDTRTVSLPPHSTHAASTFDFSVETRTTGSFPLEVRVLTPDGKTSLTSGVVFVRSTAVSAVALAATGGGALFLLFAWARRGARRRRKARTVPPGAQTR